MQNFGYFFAKFIRYLAEKDKKIIEDLERKNQEEMGKLVASNIELETLKKAEASKSRKFYMICVIILASIGAAIYFIPSGVTKGLFNIFKK